MMYDDENDDAMSMCIMYDDDNAHAHRAYNSRSEPTASTPPVSRNSTDFAICQYGFFVDRLLLRHHDAVLCAVGPLCYDIYYSVVNHAITAIDLARSQRII